jgi:hypothetical protein
MENFTKKFFSFDDGTINDNGVHVKKVLELVKDYPSYKEFYRLLEINKIKDDFIKIPGAARLISAMITVNKLFTKFDLESSYQDLEFDDSEDFSITFKNISDIEVNSIIESDEFTAKPIYSSRSDFFAGLFNMDKYATTLLGEKLRDLVNTNLKAIQKVFNERSVAAKKYRILLDSNGNYFLRAITSKRYYDYNNNIAVFIGLIVLHKEMLTSNNKFIVNRCEYNESYVRIYFENVQKQELPNVGFIKNIIEVSNDEVKREALKFSNVISISYGKAKDIDKYIFIKPQRTKAKILSIKHNSLPKTAFEELASMDNYKTVQQELYNDIKSIGGIKEASAIKFLVINKIKSAKAGELKKYKKNILSQLTEEVKTITQLLEMMHKIELLASDIDSKEYLRYIMYEALVDRK